ncbi:MAG: hypothetical protein L6V92_02765 [Phocaeicola vulgatus]|nr:MAG: hypothetical protein L6V92_02765 [Phocaeicola vulgatus]
MKMGYNGAGKDVWLLCVLMMAWSLLASCGNGEKESDENSANDALLSTIAVSEGFGGRTGVEWRYCL